MWEECLGPQVFGHRSREDVEDNLRAHWSGISSCYQRQLERERGARGTVAVTFVINPGGDVVKAHVAASINSSREFETCLVAGVRAWQFPAALSKGITIVTYPFSLASR